MSNNHENNEPITQVSVATEHSDSQNAVIIDDMPVTTEAISDTEAHTENPIETEIMSETDEPTQILPSRIKLTGRLLNFTRLSLQGNDVEDLLKKIEAKLEQQRQSKLPVVVSCEHELDLEKLWQGLWKLGLQPIGIVTSSMDEQAQQHHIPIFPVDGQRLNSPTPPKPTQIDTLDPVTDAVKLDNPHPSDEMVTLLDDKLTVNTSLSQLEGDLIHNQMLRSGQSINHVGGDVILTKGINVGAEAITDYSLHVYGKAEGRLVAGATGDKNAKIFCLKFNPSLVSVAGTYCLKENIPAEFINQAVQVSYVEGQGLLFSLMDASNP